MNNRLRLISIMLILVMAVGSVFASGQNNNANNRGDQMQMDQMGGMNGGMMGGMKRCMNGGMMNGMMNGMMMNGMMMNGMMMNGMMMNGMTNQGFLPENEVTLEGQFSLVDGQFPAIVDADGRTNYIRVAGYVTDADLPTDGTQLTATAYPSGYSPVHYIVTSAMVNGQEIVNTRTWGHGYR